MRAAVPPSSRPTRRARLGVALAVPALLALAAWAAAGPVAAADDGYSYVTLDQASSGKTVNVPSDGILAVVLQANSGTGYEWRTITEPSLSVIGPPADAAWPYTVPSSDLPGAPVAYVWYFPVSGPGRTTFSAGLYPPAVATPEETYTLDIVVRDGDGKTAAMAEADCGQIVGIDVDGVVRLTLDSNASTGYSWKVTQEPAAWLTAEPGSGDYVAPPAGSPPGAGGQQVFSWRGTASGSTGVTVGYVPPAATTPDKTCALSVVAGAPVLPPDKETAVEPGTTEPPVVGATPPPTSTRAAEALPATTAVGIGAFVLFLLLTIATMPVLAHRRRRVH
jgi:predicted secreted protein